MRQKNAFGAAKPGGDEVDGKPFGADGKDTSLISWPALAHFCRQQAVSIIQGYMAVGYPKGQDQAEWEDMSNDRQDHAQFRKS